jgi:3-isopropylmalate/(R)-2-methylmalate dehydratase small subunit
MEPFRAHRGLVAPLERRDVDTDQIIPKQFLKRLGKTGYEDCLFYDWRHPGEGRPDPGFVLDRPGYTGASVLVTGANFGCGSSREHAVWALKDFGFRVVIAPSFADIFASNSVQNGLLTAAADDDVVATIARRAAAGTGYAVDVDLDACRLRDDQGLDAPFRVDERARHRLLHGLDDIALLLQYEDAIARYEAAHG